MRDLDLVKVLKEHKSSRIEINSLRLYLKLVLFLSKPDNVLLLNDDKITEVGSPKVEGAIVEAKLLDNVKDRTVLVFHKRRRKHSRKKNGHRQRHSKIQITKILAKGGKVIGESKIVEKKKPIQDKKKVIKKVAKK